MEEDAHCVGMIMKFEVDGQGQRVRLKRHGWGRWRR